MSSTPSRRRAVSTSTYNNNSSSKIPNTKEMDDSKPLSSSSATMSKARESSAAGVTTTATSTTSKSSSSKKKQQLQSQQQQQETIDKSKINELTEPSLYRLTQGIPKHELKVIEGEAFDCEAALLEEIRILEEAIGIENTTIQKPLEKEQQSSLTPTTTTPVTHCTTPEAILTCELTPVDRYYTVSALLGRLRGPLQPPLPPNASLQRKRHALMQKSNKKQHHHSDKTLFEKQSNIIKFINTNPNYAKPQDQALLLVVWKRISSHRSAAVFRKPVNPKEVPSYEDKILFPIDLSLIRKMITSNIVRSFKDLHWKIGLMCHNCVKFNGRESDYGVITREFENYVDDAIMNAVLNQEKSSKSNVQDKKS